jgi:hypothetical protein
MSEALMDSADESVDIFGLREVERGEGEGAFEGVFGGVDEVIEFFEVSA